MRNRDGGMRRKEGRGGKRDEKEGGIRRKDGRRERSNVEEGAMRKVIQEPPSFLRNSSLLGGPPNWIQHPPCWL